MNTIEVRDGEANLTRAVLFDSRAKGMAAFFTKRDLDDYLELLYYKTNKGDTKINKRKYNAMVKKLNIDEYDYCGVKLGYLVR